MWICQACEADVQDDWNVCWNCARPRSVVPSGEADVPLAPAPSSTQPNINRKHCPKCHQNTIIPNARVSDSPIGNGSQHWLLVPENPNALIFKNLVPSIVRAWICGTCGYTELYAEEPALLWDTYQRSLLAANDGRASAKDESGIEH